MAEPLKTMYDGTFLEQFGSVVKGAWEPFDVSRFAETARKDDWGSLELKARIRRIAQALGAALPQDYEEALDILYLVDERCVGFPYLFFPDFVEVFGREERHWERSMEALARFTQRSSSEFAVRPFIIADPARMVGKLLEWSRHPSEHVRRLASEGARPRLPWGQALPVFKRDPLPLLPILEQLKADPSLYVRKSVANNLNDIAKDHPGLVLELAERWIGDNPLTDWIVRHACRTLVKRSDARAMALFGYSASTGQEGEKGEALVREAALSLSQQELEIGGELTLHYGFTIADGDGAADKGRLKLRVEYGIDFVKAGGKTSLKRFLLSDREYAAGERAEGARTHRFADLTTRKHYPGRHRFTLWVNGVLVAEAEALLKADESQDTGGV